MMKMNSRIDDMQRHLKRMKEEKALFIDANEKLVTNQREKDEEIKYLKAALETAGKIK